MKSQNRFITCGYSIAQREDGMLNATELIKMSNKKTNKNISIEEYLNEKETKEFIEVVAEQEHISEDAVVDRRGRVVWMHRAMIPDLIMYAEPISVTKQSKESDIAFQNKDNHRYTVKVNNKTMHCDSLDYVVKIIENLAGYDIDAVFSEGDRFTVLDNEETNIVASNKMITEMAKDFNEYESETLYGVINCYLDDDDDE